MRGRDAAERVLAGVLCACARGRWGRSARFILSYRLKHFWYFYALGDLTPTDFSRRRLARGDPFVPVPSGLWSQSPLGSCL